MRCIRSLLTFGLLLGLCSCGTDLPEEFDLSEAEQAKLKAVQNPFGDLIYHFGDKADRVSIGLYDCTLFRAVKHQGAVVSWQVLSRPGYYPFSFCERQSIDIKGEYVEVFSGKVAAGAGGCCATSMHYRSRDGIHWQQQVSDGWLDVVMTSAEAPEELKPKGISR